MLRPLRVIRFPAHELAMMMTIALRFIPTLMQETDKIMKAQMARGADFESGNLLKRAKAMLPLLVPLFVSAFRRADELAMAMEARCYHGGRAARGCASACDARGLAGAGGIGCGAAAGDLRRDVGEMMRVLLTLSYDGTAYAGWQRQENAVAVQQRVEEALRRLTGEPIVITGASRTDAGVHALGQRAHFDTESRIPPEKYPYDQYLLPRDIRALTGERVRDDFPPSSTRSARLRLPYTIPRTERAVPRSFRALFPCRRISRRCVLRCPR